MTTEMLKLISRKYDEMYGDFGNLESMMTTMSKWFRADRNIGLCKKVWRNFFFNKLIQILFI